MTLTLCGKCGKVKCECPAQSIAKPVDNEAGKTDERGYYGYATNAPRRPFMRPVLEEAAIILPDIVECAIFGREIKKGTRRNEVRDEDTDIHELGRLR
jgi:hypothetical protein